MLIAPDPAAEMDINLPDRAALETSTPRRQSDAQHLIGSTDSDYLRDQIMEIEGSTSGFIRSRLSFWTEGYILPTNISSLALQKILFAY